MNANKTMDRLGSEPLTDLLTDVFGSGWTAALSGRRGEGETPTAADFNESAFNFQSKLERTHALGLSTFFNIWVSEDDKKPTQNMLQVRIGVINRQLSTSYRTTYHHGGIV